MRYDAKVARFREEVTGRPFQNKIVTAYEFTEGQIKRLLLQCRLTTVYLVEFNVEHVVDDCLDLFFIFFCSSDKTKPVSAINRENTLHFCRDYPVHSLPVLVGV